MEFGALLMFRNPQPWCRPIQDVYRDLLELCVLAEKLGFDHLWTSEHLARVTCQRGHPHFRSR